MLFNRPYILEKKNYTHRRCVFSKTMTLANQSEQLSKRNRVSS